MEFFQQILQFDRELFLFLNSFYNDFWDTIMLLVTRKETWYPFYAVILFFIIKNYKSKWWLVVLFLGLTILLSDQISVFFKETIQRLRPVHNPEIQHMVHNVLRKGGSFSFVSSHAANSFALLVFSSRLFRNKGYHALLLFWALLFSYSRIYSGVHYPLDILGGALLGWLIGIGTFKLLMFFENYFFIARRPKIEKTNLSSKQFGTVFLVFVVLVSTVFLSTYLLHRFNYL